MKSFKFHGGYPLKSLKPGADLLYTPHILSPIINSLPPSPLGVSPPNLTTGGRLIVLFPTGVYVGEPVMSSFLRKKLDIPNYMFPNIDTRI